MANVVITAGALSKRYLRGASQPGGAASVLASAFPGPVRRLFSGSRGAPASSFFWALREVSFEVCKGERVGIIGRNGAGKSTLLKVLSRIVSPTSGEARIRGRVTSLLEVGTGFNPALTGRENIYLNASLYGLGRYEVDDRFDTIVEFSGIRDFLDMPVKHYSSGMFTRLAFSVAAHLDPDILFLDEVLAVGDLSFQQKCLERVEGLTSEGRTVLFVSHSMEAIARFCDRAIWLDGGRIVMDGPADTVISAYVNDVLNVRSSRTWEARPPAAAAEPQAARAAEEDARPGNEHARLVSARVVNRQGLTVTSVPIDEPVGIETVFEVVQPGKNVQPALYFDTAKGVRAFVVAYTDPDHMFERRSPGRYATTAWLPPHLLNDGVMYVTVCLCTPDPLERHCVVERALSFHVYEPPSAVGATGSTRGLFARDFPGAVRPRVDWETRDLPSSAPEETAVAREAGQAAG
jgi:lipopolysaccharide transport system ATP-binding protein